MLLKILNYTFATELLRKHFAAGINLVSVDCLVKLESKGMFGPFTMCEYVVSMLDLTTEHNNYQIFY